MTADAPLFEMPGHLIRRMNQHSVAVFQTRVKSAGHDITPVQFATLSVLVNYPGLDQATLARRVAYDRATIGGVVKRLEQKKLIRRLPDDDDRRAFKLWLSPSGKALLEALRPIISSVQEDILPNLTDAERANLIALMRKAMNLVSADGPKT